MVPMAHFVLRRVELLPVLVRVKVLGVRRRAQGRWRPVLGTRGTGLGRAGCGCRWRFGRRRRPGAARLGPVRAVCERRAHLSQSETAT